MSEPIRIFIKAVEGLEKTYVLVRDKYAPKLDTTKKQELVDGDLKRVGEYLARAKRVAEDLRRQANLPPSTPTDPTQPDQQNEQDPQVVHQTELTKELVKELRDKVSKLIKKVDAEMKFFYLLQYKQQVDKKAEGELLDTAGHFGGLRREAWRVNKADIKAKVIDPMATYFNRIKQLLSVEKRIERAEERQFRRFARYEREYRALLGEIRQLNEQLAALNQKGIAPRLKSHIVVLENNLRELFRHIDSEDQTKRALLARLVQAMKHREQALTQMETRVAQIRSEIIAFAGRIATKPELEREDKVQLVRYLDQAGDIVEQQTGLLVHDDDEIIKDINDSKADLILIYKTLKAVKRRLNDMRDALGVHGKWFWKPRMYLWKGLRGVLWKAPGWVLTRPKAALDRAKSR